MAYILLGHGSEYIHYARPVVPEGCMLVLSEECGILGTLPPQIYEAVQRPALAPLFANPVTNRRALELLFGRRLRVYQPGETYPWLTYTLINNDQPERLQFLADMPVGPSGVWPIPSPAGSMILNPDGRGEYKFMTDAEHAGKTYSHSVFPDNRAALEGLDLEALSERPELKATQEALFAAHPGIYFHFICRDIRDEGANLRGLMREHFPNVNRNVFGNVAGQYNLPGMVGNWLETVNRATFTTEQRRAASQLNRVVRNVTARRRASRSSLGGDRATTRQLMRLLALKRAPADRTVALIDGLDLAHINYKDHHDGTTPLMRAAANSHTAAVLALLARGADITVVDAHGKRALDHAATEGNPEIVAALLAAGGDVHEMDVHGLTPLHQAASEMAGAAVVPMLLAAGANPNGKDLDDDTPLHYAAGIGSREAIDAIVVAGGNINAQNNEGLTPLMTAITEDSIRGVHYMLALPGVNVGLRSTAGTSALGLALKSDNENAVLAILAAGFVPADWKPIKSAARQKRMRCLYEGVVALENGEDPAWAGRV